MVYSLIKLTGGGNWLRFRVENVCNYWIYVMIVNCYSVE
jgi:hypothetical protein